MPNNAISISDLNACTAPASTDLLVLASNVAGNAETLNVVVDDLFNNSSVNSASFASIAITSNTTPANNTDNAGRPAHSIWSDGTYVYSYDGTEIKRLTLTTF